jgi:hypothetical protein
MRALQPTPTENTPEVSSTSTPLADDADRSPLSLRPLAPLPLAPPRPRSWRQVLVWVLRGALAIAAVASGAEYAYVLVGAVLFVQFFMEQ